MDKINKILNQSGTKKTLTCDQKMGVFSELEGGSTVAELAQKHKVSSTTIYRMKKLGKRGFEDKLGQFCEDYSVGDRKRLKFGKYESVEKATYTWIVQKRAQGFPITDALISEVALTFFKKLFETTNEEFKASSGWIRNFKQRHEIRSVKLCGEKKSADHAAAERYKLEFPLKITGFADVYNMDEFALYWRSLPEKSLVLKDDQPDVR